MWMTPGILGYLDKFCSEWTWYSIDWNNVEDFFRAEWRWLPPRHHTGKNVASFESLVCQSQVSEFISQQSSKRFLAWAKKMMQSSIWDFKNPTIFKLVEKPDKGLPRQRQETQPSRWGCEASSAAPSSAHQAPAEVNQWYLRDTTPMGDHLASNNSRQSMTGALQF